jgi:putative ABC transport system permease protein
MMYVLRLAFLQLKSKPVNSLLSLLLFAIGMAMISFMILSRKHLDELVSRNMAGIDLVAGAKGSPLQLILSSVMHIDYPTGNISLADANQLSNHPMIKQTIPIALGDNYMGFRIVGTTHEYASLYEATLADGDWHEHVLDVSLGSRVARQTGLVVGETFTGVHGLQHAGHAHHDHVYTVRGILNPTGTVIDKLILTALESVWAVHDHGMDTSDGHQLNIEDHHNHNTDTTLNLNLNLNP